MKWAGMRNIFFFTWPYSKNNNSQHITGLTSLSLVGDTLVATTVTQPDDDDNSNINNNNNNNDK